MPIGVPLPPLAGKQRVSLLIPPEGILQSSLPPSLHAMTEVADLRLAIHDRCACCHRRTERCRARGLWQHLTGLAYLTPHSDLDVLWPIPPGLAVRSLVCSIAAVQREAPVRIDGEIIFPNGSAVNWRELWNAHQAADQATVLAKTIEGVEILDLATLAHMAGTHERDPPIRVVA